eukprot:Em0005g750a
MVLCEGHWWFCSSDGRDAQTHLQRPQVQGLGVGLHSTGCRDLRVLGTEARDSSRLAVRLALQLHCSKSKALVSIYQRLNLTLVRCAARALLSRVGTQTPEGPCASGNIFGRRQANCTEQRDKISSFFQPSQFGVACKADAEKIVPSLRRCIEENWLSGDFVVFKVDMSNAFNMVSRQAVMDQCATYFPELFPWVSWCYGSHTSLWHTMGQISSQSGVQQGDPLGPMLFALVLHKLITSIDADDDCLQLLLEAWYLDDGVLAGRVVKSSLLPNLDILGAPIGDSVHCSRFIAEKCAMPKILLKALVDVSTVDLHMAFSLLRIHCADYLKLFDEEVRLFFTSCIAVDVPDPNWQQAQLSQSFGGLGFRSLALHCSAAFIASLASSGFGSADNIHMLQAVTRFNTRVPPDESITAEEVLVNLPTQRALSKKLDMHAFQSLLSSSSPVNKARILSVSAPHAGSWISVIPSTGLDLHLNSAECQIALRWWLGLDTSGGSLCPHCPDTALDPLGHHAASCRHGGDVVARHNHLRDIFANFCRRAQLSVRVEVGGWDRGKPAAFDATVASPLTPVTLNNASTSMGAAAYAAELRKHVANDTRCQELGWTCIPLAVETYGNWGMEAQSVFTRLASLLAIGQAIPKPKMLGDIYGHLNMSLVRSVARAIMGRENVRIDLLPWASWCYGQQPLLQHPLGTLTSEVGVQQSDPLGPMFFSLVLHKLVSAIATDEDTAKLLFHAWYLDDGVVAGPKQSVLHALAIIQELGPPLGLVINPSKCELYSQNDMSVFSSQMKQSNMPHLEILGSPIGDTIFCANVVSQKCAQASQLLSQIEEVGSVDPQVDVWRILYFDNDVRHCLASCTGVDTSDDAWEQAQLSLSRGGLGFRRLSKHSPACYIASVCMSGLFSAPQQHLLQSIDDFNHCIPPSKAISFESLTNTPSSQKAISGEFEDELFRQLLSKSSVPDRARLLSVSSPHASAWLSVVPSPGLNLHLEPAEFQAAIQWWLGIGVAHGSVCSHCPHSLDPLGHHALTCKHGWDVVNRHNRLRNVFAESCRRACIGVQVEAGSGLGRHEHHTRPADVLATNWMLGKPAAFDFAVTSPLDSSPLHEASVTAGSAAHATEARKHQENDVKCAELGWVSIPVVVETYECWGTEAKWALSQLVS